MAISDVDLTAAGGSQNLTGFDKVLKEFYLGPVREQLNSDTLLMQRLQKDNESVSGRQVRIPLHVGRNEGIGSGAEGGLLPDPGVQSYEDMTFKVKYHYGRILLSGPVIFASANDKGSFIRALDSEIKGLVDDIKHDVNRQMFSDGSGIPFTSRATGGIDVSSDIAIATGFEVANYGDYDNVGANLKHARPGMFVTPFDASTDALLGQPAAGTNARHEIGSVDVSGKKIYLTAIVDGISSTFVTGFLRNTAATSALTYAQIDTHTSWVKELMGLLGICHGSPVYREAGSNYVTEWEPSGVTTATELGKVWQSAGADGTAQGSWDHGQADLALGGLQGLVHDQWEPQVVVAGTEGTPTAPVLTDMQSCLDLMMEFGQAKPSIILTTYALRQKYFGLLTDEKRYVNTLELDGGWTALEFNGIPLVADKDAIPGYMFMLDEDQLALFSENDWSWMDRDGSQFVRLPDKDAFQATMFKYYEMGCYRRNGQCVYRNLVE